MIPRCEVGVGAVEADEFAPAHAGVGGGDDEDLFVEAVDALDDGVDLLRCGVGAFGAPAGAGADVGARVVADASVGDGFAHQGG